MKFTDLLSSLTSGGSVATSHMKNLLEMAEADGQFLESEKELLKSIARRNGISDSQLDSIQKNPSKVQFEVPKNERQKFLQLFELVSMMNIDKQVHNKEAELAHLFAIKFGYKREIAKELVEAIRQNIENGSTVDETMKRAQLMIA